MAKYTVPTYAVCYYSGTHKRYYRVPGYKIKPGRRSAIEFALARNSLDTQKAHHAVFFVTLADGDEAMHRGMHVSDALPHGKKITDFRDHP